MAVSLAGVLLATSLGSAQEISDSFAPLGDESENYALETVLEGLDRPGGVVLRVGSAKAGPPELFFAENGAGRILRIAIDRPKETSEVVTGLSKHSLEDELFSRLGPVGLAFLTRTKLAVGGSGQGAVGLYILPDDGSAVAADQPNHTVGVNSNGPFFAMAKSEKTLFMTGADKDRGWILQSEVGANRLATLGSFATEKKTKGLGKATGIAITPRPRPPFLVVAHVGNLETPQDSTISFYVSSSATVAMTLGTGLHDIVALAYSPSGQLYAADFAINEEESGGIYRLDDAYLSGQPTCQAVKIASIPRPTSLVFTPDGALFTTALGADENAKQGIVVKITGEF